MESLLRPTFDFLSHIFEFFLFLLNFLFISLFQLVLSFIFIYFFSFTFSTFNNPADEQDIVFRVLIAI